MQAMHPWLLLGNPPPLAQPHALGGGVGCIFENQSAWPLEMSALSPILGLEWGWWLLELQPLWTGRGQAWGRHGWRQGASVESGPRWESLSGSFGGPIFDGPCSLLLAWPGEGRTLSNSGFLSRAPAPGKMTEEADSASSPLSSPLLLPVPGIQSRGCGNCLPLSPECTPSFPYLPCPFFVLPALASQPVAPWLLLEVLFTET